MGTRYYNRNGRLTGYTVTQRDQRAMAQFEIFGLGVAIASIPFLPILIPCYFLFKFLWTDLGWHPLFAGLAAAAPAIIAFALLWLSRLFRTVYSGFVTLIVTYLAYVFVMNRTSDPIWSIAAAVVAFILGVIITVRISGYFRPRPEEDEIAA